MPVTVAGAPFAYQPMKLADSLGIGRTLGLTVSNPGHLSWKDLGTRLDQQLNIRFEEGATKDDQIIIDESSARKIASRPGKRNLANA